MQNVQKYNGGHTTLSFVLTCSCAGDINTAGAAFTRSHASNKSNSLGQSPLGVDVAPPFGYGMVNLEGKAYQKCKGMYGSKGTSVVEEQQIPPYTEAYHPVP